MTKLGPNAESTFNRRTLLAGLIMLPTALTTSPLLGKVRRFVFKIKTKSENIVSNVVIEASDLDAAKAKLMKRYPGCTVLSSSEK